MNVNEHETFLTRADVVREPENPEGPARDIAVVGRCRADALSTI